MQKIQQRLLSNSRQLRQNQTKAECLLWRKLREEAFKTFHFKRQKVIGPFIVDFYCSKARLVIELDGGQHNEEERIIYDDNRAKYLKLRGFKVIRFWNNDVFRQLDGVLVSIWRELFVSPPSPEPLPQAGEELGCAPRAPASNQGNH